MHRYRNARSPRFAPLLELLSDRQQKEAEILGRAMRFGAMFSANDGARMGQLKFRPKRKELVLTLPHEAAPLFGEVAAARFESLAKSLDATPIQLLRG